MSSSPLLVLYLRISLSPRSYDTFRKVASFYGTELLAQRQTAKMEYHPLPAVWCSSIRNMGTRHAAVTGAHLSGASSKKRIKSVSDTSGENADILSYGRWHRRTAVPEGCSDGKDI